MDTPTTAELLEWIDEDIKETRIHALSSPETSVIRERWEKRLDVFLALRAIVVGAEAERAKVKWLRAALEDSNGLLKSMLGNEANEGGAFGDQLIDNETALAETEPKEDEHE
jgi:hypothetical protein